jgi:hypothetical protein
MGEVEDFGLGTQVVEEATRLIGETQPVIAELMALASRRRDLLAAGDTDTAIQDSLRVVQILATLDRDILETMAMMLINQVEEIHYQSQQEQES